MRNYYTLINSMGSGAAAIDSDAQAFITAASITDSTQQTAINSLVTDLKGYGIWTKMKAIYPFVGGSASSHKFNLKDPRDLNAAYRLTFYGGWTHSSTGALPNGTTGYANSYFIPSIDFAELGDNSGVTYYNSNVYTGDGDGVYSTGTRFLFGANPTGIDIRMNTDSNTPFSIGYISNGLGIFTVSKNNTSTVSAYHNGTLIGSEVKTTALVNKEIYIGCRNQDGTPGAFFPQEKRFISLHTGLTPTEVGLFKNAILNFNTILSR